MGTDRRFDDVRPAGNGRLAVQARRSRAAARLAATDRVAIQAAGRARPKMEEPAKHSHRLADQRVRRLWITCGERRFPETSRVSGRTAAAARLRYFGEWQPDA